LVVKEAPGFQLQIAGDGPLREELTALSKKLSLDSHVQFLGMVRDVPALLQRASLYVLSSISEGVSLTILEAMARGLPIVATRVGGTPEAVRDGANGLLVPPGDPRSLAVSLLRLWRDDTLARRLGEAGRLRVLEHFDVRRMVARYEQVYRGATVQACSDAAPAPHESTLLSQT
jgi:glycosyltransferase involved in cell wall biosynthesis